MKIKVLGRDRQSLKEHLSGKSASKVIERDMPILAISAYHRQEDFITLIPYISSLCNEEEKYNLYLRYHGVVATELVIYAIPVAYNS